MKNFIRFLIIVGLSCLDFHVWAQDSLYYRGLVKKLSSEEFKGRGYSFGGNRRAAEFIAKEYENLGLKNFDNNYMQLLHFPINIFEGNACVHFGNEIEEMKLFENVEFMAYSKGLKGSFRLKNIKAESIPEIIKSGKTFENQFICIDISKLDGKDSAQKELLKTINANLFRNMLQAKGYIVISEKLMPWHIGLGQYEKQHTVINVVKNSLNGIPKKVYVDLDQRFEPEFHSQNVCAYIEGKSCPDSFFVFTGHYDHLGTFGKDYVFHGANDNASGTAFVIDLARHFSLPENRPDYSIVFMNFTGEEVGLLGSFYAAENPLFPLDKIKMLINLDMIGTGEDGITVVCATGFPEEFKVLTDINEEKKYLKKINPRKPTANSDHYPFYEKGCKTFFIYGMGKSGPYHKSGDTLDAMSLGGYTGLFKLLTDYISLHKR